MKLEPCKYSKDLVELVLTKPDSVIIHQCWTEIHLRDLVQLTSPKP